MVITDEIYNELKKLSDEGKNAEAVQTLLQKIEAERNAKELKKKTDEIARTLIR